MKNVAAKPFSICGTSFIFKAISEFSMIRDKDRVLLCLSGGKDSLSMLHVIHQYQFYAKSLVCVRSNV